VPADGEEPPDEPDEGDEPEDDGAVGVSRLLLLLLVNSHALERSDPSKSESKAVL